MLIIAKSVPGHEYIYSPATAHKVPKASAERMKNVLNTCRYKLKDNETWFVHEVDKYDTAFDYAQFQSFRFYKGTLYEKVN